MQVNGIPVPVFPLSKANQYLHGYYMDSACRIWSTRAGKQPQPLLGSQNPSGHYYTLNRQTYRSEQLVRLATSHRDYIAETSDAKTSSAQLATGVCLKGRTKSASAAATAKGYLLATLTPDDRLVFGTEPMFHMSDTTAKEEAERVAGTSGREVVLLRIVGKVKVQKAVWE